MGLVIGMDEAGYGPNYGPLVVTATAWDVPGLPGEAEFWKRFRGILGRTPSADGRRLHVADSKEVYRPAGGLEALERSVRCLLGLAGPAPATFRDLWTQVAGGLDPDEEEPWLDGCDLALPRSRAVADCPADDALAGRWRARCERSGLRLRAVRSDIVLPGRFNRLVRESGSKGLALSRISLALLRQVWDDAHETPALVVADKHGGRNRYDQLLSEVVEDRLVLCRGEGRERSVYRVGMTEVHFQTRAEEHFPVALASMVSKYIRELSMELFNRFWRTHEPELRPTAGYPSDARRFRREIAATQARLGIADERLWRER